MRYFVSAVAVTAMLLAGCANLVAEPPRAPIAPQPLVPRLCDAAKPGVYGARTLGNKTKATIELAATDDLLMTALSESGCFVVAERDKVSLLIDEMKLCSDDNPDKGFFECRDFAQKGHLLGVTHMVFGDVTMAEDKVKGVDLHLRLPEVGGLGAGRTYSALSVSLRVVEVETGRVVSSKVVSAVFPEDQGGLDVAYGGFSLKAAAYQRTPAGKVLQDMIAGAIQHFAAASGS